jgi:GNAT superfamily N-acetyltransferase
VASRIDIATSADIADIIASADALVTTDAGRYDAAGTDLGWAGRHGIAYASALLASDDNVALLARDGDVLLGHLVGRLFGPGTVHPVRVAELESIHVYPAHRGRGVGEQLVERFLAWAVDKGADRASVAAYYANEGAQRFYARHGFAPRSVTLDRALPGAADTV